MTEPDRTDEEPAMHQRQGMPRWVLGFIVAGAVVVALVVVMLALGHSPRQHMGSPAVVSSATPSRW